MTMMTTTTMTTMAMMTTQTRKPDGNNDDNNNGDNSNDSDDAKTPLGDMHDDCTISSHSTISGSRQGHQGRTWTPREDWMGAWPGPSVSASCRLCSMR